MILSVSGVSKSFGATQALRGVELNVSAGETLGLLGENGSGKSTLMRILHGELRPDSGSMQFEGRPYDPHSPHEAMECGVALVHQELAIAEHLTITENIFLGAECSRMGLLSRKEMDEVARDCLTRLGRGDLAHGRLAGSLSTADRQIVEIARALRTDAKLVLFDEPTSSLGHADSERLFEVIRHLAAEGRAIIYITHFLDEVREICSRVSVLRDGENAGDADPKETSPRMLAAMMSGAESGQEFVRSSTKMGPVVLEAKEVAGAKLKGKVSLVLREGEVVGLAGLNGAGRTEVARALFGLDRSSGSIAHEGRALGPSSGERWKRNVGFVSEDRKNEGLVQAMSLADNVHLPSRGSFFRSTPQESQSAKKALDALQVRRRSERQSVSELSGGNQQKVALARLLQADAKVWILDEPTRGIDVRTKSEIFRLIAEKASAGCSILLISSQLDELLSLSDRILVLRRGEIVAEVDPRATTAADLLGMCSGA